MLNSLKLLLEGGVQMFIAQVGRAGGRGVLRPGVRCLAVGPVGLWGATSGPTGQILRAAAALTPLASTKPSTCVS
jgi:hypothetical protein